MQASIAERIAFGRSYDPVADDTVVVPRSGTALVGRILISAIFLVSGIAKLTDPTGSAAYMTSAGIGNADVLVYIAGIAELAGGLSLLFGFLTRIGAMGLIVMLVLINVLMHNFWALPEPESKAQMVQFVKNLAIMGGLFMVVAMGPGRYSLDALMRREKTV
jgi:putative oxidoreductase